MSVAQFRVCASWVLCKCHSPFRVSETQGHAKAWTPNSAVQVYGPNARPKLDVEAFHEPASVCSPAFTRLADAHRLKPGLQTQTAAVSAALARTIESGRGRRSPTSCRAGEAPVRVHGPVSSIQRLPVTLDAQAEHHEQEERDRPHLRGDFP